MGQHSKAGSRRLAHELLESATTVFSPFAKHVSVLEEAQHIIELQHVVFQDKLQDAEILIHKLRSNAGFKYAADVADLIASWQQKSGNLDMVLL